MRCPQCDSGDFKSSRLRPEDFPFLLLLLWPVRCNVCMRRRYGFLIPALAIRQQEKVDRAEADGRA
jgi:nitrate reductase NapE component